MIRLQELELHLVYFISNAVKIRRVGKFSTFYGRCLFLLLNSTGNLDSRCLFSQALENFLSLFVEMCNFYRVMKSALYALHNNC